MRYALLAVALVVGLATPGLAKASAALPFDLTFTGTNTSGTISGTFGGLPVTGTYSNGTWTLMVDGKVFATGTYSCSSACTFTGTRLAGKPIAFIFTSSSLTGTKTGTLSLSPFATHGAWVSTVAQWANANLSQKHRGLIVSAAARIEGPLAAQGHGNAGGNGHDGGGGRDGGHRR